MSGITLTEVDEATVPNPAAGKRTIFLDEADGYPKTKDSSGTVESLQGPQGDPGDPGAPGAGSITIDGATGDGPVAGVDTVVFDGATVTDDGGGQVTVSGLGGGGGGGDIVHHATQTQGSAGATLQMSGIPGSGQNLRLVIAARIPSASSFDVLRLLVGNGSVDTGSNYTFERKWGAGGVATTAAYAEIGGVNGDSSVATAYSRVELTIYEYAGSRWKFFTFRGAGIASDGFLLTWGGGVWKSTSAIDVVRINAAAGGNIDAGSYIEAWLENV